MLLNILTGLTGTNEFTELLVAAHNVDENMGQIVVHALIVLHHDRGAHREGRNRQDRAHHPRRVGELGVKAEDLDGVVRHALEAAENHLGLDGNNLVGRTCEFALESAHGSLDFFNLLDHLGSAGGTRRSRSLGLLSHEIYGPPTDIG